jgi:hypothetical protein
MTKKKKQKYYVLNQDDPNYSIALERDDYGGCSEFKTFAEAKANAIGCILDDISELKGTLSEIRALRKKDLK